MKTAESPIMRSSREFFEQVVQPFLEMNFPDIEANAACGFFGWGSECLAADDELSSDHHFGIRVDMLLPEHLVESRSQAMLEALAGHVPDSFQGIPLREGHVKGAGVAPESLESFLGRTVGLRRAPQTAEDWLKVPEVDIVHVINGHLWHDPSGRFTTIRRTYEGYYPDEVWKRRLAHWCRYFSGMGLYAVKRALLRDNYVFATTSFGRTLQFAMELAFLINRTYSPYDKWLNRFFRELPLAAPEMAPLIEEAAETGCPWPRRLDICESLADILDETMVARGIVPPHPKFTGSPSSGYRLLEHHYNVLIKAISSEVRAIVPQMEQIHLEEFHAPYVAALSLDVWDHLLNLTPEEK